MYTQKHHYTLAMYTFSTACTDITQSAGHYLPKKNNYMTSMPRNSKFRVYELHINEHESHWCVHITDEVYTSNPHRYTHVLCMYLHDHAQFTCYAVLCISVFCETVFAHKRAQKLFSARGQLLLLALRTIYGCICRRMWQYDLYILRAALKLNACDYMHCQCKLHNGMITHDLP